MHHAVARLGAGGILCALDDKDGESHKGMCVREMMVGLVFQNRRESWGRLGSGFRRRIGYLGCRRLIIGVGGSGRGKLQIGSTCSLFLQYRAVVMKLVSSRAAEFQRMSAVDKDCGMIHY